MYFDDIVPTLEHLGTICLFLAVRVFCPSQVFHDIKPFSAAITFIGRIGMISSIGS